MGGPMVCRTEDQYLGHRPDGHRDAKRGRRRWRLPRSSTGGFALHHFHGIAGAPADDPQHVPDRGRTPRHGVSHRPPPPRRPGPLHLRDHSDVMAARSTGFGMLSSNSVQEVMDMALIAQAATLESRIPFMHFFDGFRTSHEVAKVEQLSAEDIRAMTAENLVFAHRSRAL